MRRKKFIFLFTLFILIFLCYLLLNNNDFSVKYKSAEKLIENYYEEYFGYNRNISTGTPLFVEDFIILGEYNNGYLLIVNAYSLNPLVSRYIITNINGIEIPHGSGTEFYYFKDKIFSPNIFCIGLEVMYKNGYLNDDDLLDIQKKFNENKGNDPDYPYYIAEHYPIN